MSNDQSPVTFHPSGAVTVKGAKAWTIRRPTFGEMVELTEAWEDLAFDTLPLLGEQAQEKLDALAEEHGVDLSTAKRSELPKEIRDMRREANAETRKVFTDYGRQVWDVLGGRVALPDDDRDLDPAFASHTFYSRLVAHWVASPLP